MDAFGYFFADSTNLLSTSAELVFVATVPMYPLTGLFVSLENFAAKELAPPSPE
jgi:hypothetical protein